MPDDFGPYGLMKPLENVASSNRGVVIDILEPANSLASGLRLQSLLYGLNSESFPEHQVDMGLNDKLNGQVRDKERRDMSGMLKFTIDPDVTSFGELT